MPMGVPGPRAEGPEGYTYAAVIVRAGREQTLAALREIGFSGWAGPAEDGWVPCVARHGIATVAAGRRGALGVGQWLAGRLDTVAVAFRVVQDRQLVLGGWRGGEELGRYVSDPSFGLPAGDDTLPDPLGTEHAGGFAAACGHPENAADLGDLLAEELDADSVIESERLAGVLRLLGLPRWLVAAASLPKDVPAGPRAGEFVRLGAGAPGVSGRLRGRAADVVRRRRPPAPDIPDAPRGGLPPEAWDLM